MELKVDSKASLLAGKYVLVVEDEYFIADDLARRLKAAGAVPVGPLGTIAKAEARIAAGGIDAAILDLNLHGEMAFALATRLTQAGMPCLIVSGYGEQVLPVSVTAVARLEKPVDAHIVVARLEELLAARALASSP